MSSSGVSKVDDGSARVTIWGEHLCQNGSNKEIVQPFPLDVNFGTPITVLQVSCGFDHTLLLARVAEGVQKVFAWGKNSQGQLGVSRKVLRQAVDPFPLDNIGRNPDKVQCGARSSFVANESGQVLAFGFNKNGQLGIGPSKSSVEEPSKVLFPDEKQRITIVDIQCGFKHTVFVVEVGSQIKLFGCGSN